MIFAIRAKSGKILVYLRAYRMRTEQYSIETRLFSKEKWEVNVNLPLFDNQVKAEKWLKSHYDLLTENG